MRTTAESIEIAPAPAAAIELSLVVPVFNEEESVGPLIARIQDAMVGYAMPWELILVDDGSTDATLANARAAIGRAGLDLYVVALQRNFGQTAAMQAGITQARGRLIATLDGDLQNDPHDIPRMIEALEERDLDMLCGWRKARQDGLWLRLIPSWTANRLIRSITGVHIHDYGCGLKLYRAEIVKQVRIMGGMHRFIPAWIASVVPSTRIGEMVVNHHARQFGTSKYGLSRTFRVILDLLAVLFFMRFRARPGHFFGMIGLAFGGISALMFLWLLIVKFGFGEDIGTRPLLTVAMMLFLGSVQMITTGILAEMMARSDNARLGYSIRKIHEAGG